MAKKLTMSVPEAGAEYFGLSRNASYEAAERGEIPVIRIGKLLRVPRRGMEKLLDSAGAKPASRRRRKGKPAAEGAQAEAR